MITIVVQLFFNLSLMVQVEWTPLPFQSCYFRKLIPTMKLTSTIFALSLAASTISASSISARDADPESLDKRLPVCISDTLFSHFKLTSTQWKEWSQCGFGGRNDGASGRCYALDPNDGSRFGDSYSCTKVRTFSTLRRSYTNVRCTSWANTRIGTSMQDAEEWMCSASGTLPGRYIQSL